MNYLIDTHTFLWYISDDPQLSIRAKNAINDPNSTNQVSIASLWEIAIKISKGNLELTKPFETLDQQLAINGFELLPVLFDHTVQLCSLPHHHGDPFDRIIIAQAITEKFTVISKDKNFPNICICNCFGKLFPSAGTTEQVYSILKVL